MNTRAVTIHPLNVKPGDVVITVISDTQITVEREVPELSPRDQVHEILREVQKRGGQNFVADLDSYTDRVMAVLDWPRPALFNLRALLRGESR